jgi:hypothetical protein
MFDSFLSFKKKLSTNIHLVILLFMEHLHMGSLSLRTHLNFGGLAKPG